MDSKYQAHTQVPGPHTAHTIFKITVALLLALLYTIFNFYGFWTAVKVVLFFYFAVPILIRSSGWVQKSLIFLHNVYWSPSDPAYFTPSYHNVEGGRNFYLNATTSQEAPYGIGVWHILPASLAAGAEEKSDDYYRQALATSGKPIVMYFHGNMGSRATAHRVDLYKVIQAEQMLDCHVIAFDYTGFADTEPQILPSETSVVRDSFAVYKWVCDTVAKSGNSATPPKLFVWGHSLGTSIATHMLAKLQDPESNFRKTVGQNMLKASGLILESPFTTMADTFYSFPLNMVYTVFWPNVIFEWFFVVPMFHNDVVFESDTYMSELNTIPAVIFHATSDVVVPFDLGEKLYKRVRAARENSTTPSAPITFQRLDDFPYELAHTFQYTHNKFPRAVRDFCMNI